MRCEGDPPKKNLSAVAERLRLTAPFATAIVYALSCPLHASLYRMYCMRAIAGASRDGAAGGERAGASGGDDS